MNGYLKQSTAAQVRTIGPFVDDTDFKTLENALTINNTDIVISANGGADTVKNSGGATAHGAGGIYTLTWDATDTAAVGELSFSVKVAGALVVFGTYVVLEEAVYDAMFAASAVGPLLANSTGSGLTAIPWNAAWDAEVESEVDDALGGGTGTALTAIPWNAAWDAEVESEVDDALGGGTGTALTGIPWNAAWDAEVQSEVDDALLVHHLDHLIAVADPGGIVANDSLLAKLVSKSATAAFADYVNTTDSLQAIRDELGNATYGLAALETLVDDIETALAVVDDYVDTEVAAIKAKTDSLTFTVAGQVDANMRRINGTTVAGDGGATPWGP